jgi:uncharacterized membrane protein YqjE
MLVEVGLGYLLRRAQGTAMAQTQDTRPIELKTLLAGMLGDVRTLVRQEVSLAQHEVQDEIDKALRAAAWFMIAAVLAIIGLFAIATAGTLILFDYTGLPAWACAAIVSVVLLIGAGCFVAIARSMVRTIHVLPLRTIRTLKDDVKWMVEWVRAKRIWT